MIDQSTRLAPGAFVTSPKSLLSSNSSGGSAPRHAVVYSAPRRDMHMEITPSEVSSEFLRLEQVLLRQRSELEGYLSESVNSAGVRLSQNEHAAGHDRGVSGHGRSMSVHERSYFPEPSASASTPYVTGDRSRRRDMRLEHAHATPSGLEVSGRAYQTSAPVHGAVADGFDSRTQDKSGLNMHSMPPNVDQRFAADTGARTAKATSALESPGRLIGNADADATGDVAEEGGPAQASGSRATTEVCKICKKSFMNQITLQNHVRVVHDKAGEFKCTACEKVFMWRSTLRNHVRLVHEKHRPHSCSVCHLRFRWKSHLDEHVLVVHNREQPWECEKCGKLFGRKNNCKKHSRRCGGVLARPGYPLTPGNKPGHPDSSANLEG